jgi:DNA-binding Xre family transcriptional regulator
MTPFAANLRFLMRRRGLSFREFATRTGVREYTLRRLVNDQVAHVETSTVPTLARVLGVSVGDLWDEPERLMARMRPATGTAMAGGVG